jgi:hypothetical protein
VKLITDLEFAPARSVAATLYTVLLRRSDHPDSHHRNGDTGARHRHPPARSEAWLNQDALRPSRWANRSPYARRSRPRYPVVPLGSAPTRARPRHAHNALRGWPGLHRLCQCFYASLRVRLWQARPQLSGRVVPDRYFRWAHHRECRSLPHLALWRRSRPRRLRPPGRRLVCSG